MISLDIPLPVCSSPRRPPRKGSSAPNEGPRVPPALPERVLTAYQQRLAVLDHERGIDTAALNNGISPRGVLCEPEFEMDPII
jgi:hypothetical protein